MKKFDHPEFEEGKMYCPVCKTELVYHDTARYQSLCEHVGHPNDDPSMKKSYKCSNEDCVIFHSYVWTRDGEIYSGKIHMDAKQLCIDKNEAPFGTFERKIQVEIYKKDENHPLFGIKTKWGYIEVKYLYKSNIYGDIIKRKRSYQLWIKNDHSSRTLWSNMLWFCLKRVFRTLRKKKGSYLSNDDVTNFIPFSWDKRWWSRTSSFIGRCLCKTFRPGLWREIEKLSKR